MWYFLSSKNNVDVLWSLKSMISWVFFWGPCWGAMWLLPKRVWLLDLSWKMHSKLACWEATYLDTHKLCRHRLKHSAKNRSHATVGQGALLTKKRNVLCSQIQAWEQIHTIYMPGLLQLWMGTVSFLPNPSLHPEENDLWLPSRIPAKQWDAICITNLPAMEDKLWTAQCKDSLDNLISFKLKPG